MSRLPKIRSSSFVYTPVDQTGEEEEWWTDEGEESEENGSTSSQGTIVAKSNKKHYPPRPIDLIPGNTLPVEVISLNDLNYIAKFYNNFFFNSI